MKTEQSQSNCCVYYCTVGAGSPAFKISLIHYSWTMYVYVNCQKAEVYTKAESEGKWGCYKYPAATVS